MAFLDVFKILILPALIAAALYGLISYIILPLYRSHHQRYAEYLPLGQLSERTSGFRTRLKNSFTRFLIPRALHWRYDFSTARYGEDRRGSDGSGSVELFGAEEGESMVGFDISRRRTEEARWGDGRVERAQEVDSNRRLSRELEEGFRDESEDEEATRHSNQQLNINLHSTYDTASDLVHNILSSLCHNNHHHDSSTTARTYDHTTGIEAFIRPFNSQDNYTEYDAPRDSELYTHDPRVRFIEAVTDERYEMGINLHPNFDFKRQSHVEVKYEIDGGTRCMVGYISQDSAMYDGLYQGRAHYMNLPVGGVWQKVGFAFGEVQQDEDIHLSRMETEHEAERRGKITITFRRGTVTEVPNRIIEDSTSTLELPWTSSKTVTVDRGRSHSSRSIPLGRAKIPTYSEQFKPARAQCGRPIVFTFYYVSRMILEIKKIIPGVATPATPAPSSAEESDAIVVSRPTTSSTRKRKRLTRCSSIIRDECDDEEVLPRPRVRTEPADASENTSGADSIARPASVTNTQTTDRETTATPIPNEGRSSLPDTAPIGVTQSAIEKEKARIRLELREIRLERRLLELDADGNV